MTSSCTVSCVCSSACADLVQFVLPRCPMSMDHAILHSHDTLALHSLNSSCSPHLRLYVPEGGGLYPLPSRRGRERWGNLSDCLKGGNGEISSECAYRKTCITLMSDFGKVASLHNGGSTSDVTLAHSK